MARLMKDRNGRYQIEVARARKYVHCVIKDGCLVRTKKWPLAKSIKNDQADIGEQTYDKWWRPVPETEYPLAKAVEQFLEAGAMTGWSITDKARSVLTALKEQKPVSDSDLGDDEAVPPPATAGGEISKGESDMSKKAKSSKKTAKPKGNGAAKPKAEKGYKGHRAGSRKEEAHRFMDEKKPDRQAFIKHCEGKGLSPATASSWYGAFKK